ncbi:MAG: AAA family ATPase [Verrucomicrobia bacterium]|nr:AAA family ATPase [Verrucomicrobiota bacterium]
MSNIILIGFKSSGKTTLGKKIAEKTGRHFIDTDELVSKNCRALYLQGPEAFREIEKEVIRALADFQNTVIATGGGAIIDPENAMALKNLGKLIYLQVEKEELKRRLLVEPFPAFLDPQNPEVSFEKMYQERLGLYEQAADFIVAHEEDLWELLASKNHWQ